MRDPDSVVVDGRIDRVDWAQAKADLTADDFYNGRTPQALRRSFEQSQVARSHRV